MRGLLRGMTERQWVTLGLFLLILLLLGMAGANPKLWDVEVFKVIIQAAVLTGLLNMVLAFHFAANMADETRAENTGKAFEAITATARKEGGGAAEAADEVASAAAERAEDFSPRPEDREL